MGRAGIFALRIFGYVWIVLAALAILAGIWMSGGFSAVQTLMSPFNVINWLVMAASVAPGLIALMWADKLKARHAAPLKAS